MVNKVTTSSVIYDLNDGTNWSVYNVRIPTAVVENFSGASADAHGSVRAKGPLFRNSPLTFFLEFKAQASVDNVLTKADTVRDHFMTSNAIELRWNGATTSTIWIYEPTPVPPLSVDSDRIAFLIENDKYIPRWGPFEIEVQPFPIGSTRHAVR